MHRTLHRDQAFWKNESIGDHIASLSCDSSNPNRILPWFSPLSYHIKYALQLQCILVKLCEIN